jgi:hypothetical protein
VSANYLSRFCFQFCFVRVSLEVIILLFLSTCSRSVESFSCDFRMVHSAALGSSYTCELNRRSESGPHLPDLDDQNVTVVRIVDTNPSTIDFDPRFPNVIAIAIENVNMKRLRIDSKFSNLRILAISRSKIHKLDLESLRHLTKLDRLYLQNNELDRIDYRIFEHLEHLNIVDLRNNTCINEYYDLNLGGELLKTKLVKKVGISCLLDNEMFKS